MPSFEQRFRKPTSFFHSMLHILSNNFSIQLFDYTNFSYLFHLSPVIIKFRCDSFLFTTDQEDGLFRFPFLLSGNFFHKFVLLWYGRGVVLLGL